MLNSQALGGVAGASAARQSTTARPVYDIEVVREPALAYDRLVATQRGGLTTPFQGADWISAWYASLGLRLEAEPLFIFVTERETGEAVVTLPLIRHRVDGLDVIAFADLGVTDYNAPILGPAAPVSADAAQDLWADTSKVLPPADLIQLRKMPASIQGHVNPLALLRGAHPSHSPGFSVTLPGDWEEYLRSLTKKFRKELGRSFRLLEREGNAAFRRVETVDEALAILDVMTEQQRARLEEMGTAFALGEDDYQAFYAALARSGLKNGTTILTTLTCNGEIVAALLGVTNGRSLAMVRLSNAGGDWMKVGPGRLIIERTMHALHGAGCRHFDFSIGDYPYKSGFGAASSPLLDLVVPRSWAGRTHAMRDLAKAAVKRGLGAMGVSLVPKAVKKRYARYRSTSAT